MLEDEWVEGGREGGREREGGGMREGRERERRWGGGQPKSMRYLPVGNVVNSALLELSLMPAAFSVKTLNVYGLQMTDPGGSTN